MHIRTTLSRARIANNNTVTRARARILTDGRVHRSNAAQYDIEPKQQKKKYNQNSRHMEWSRHTTKLDNIITQLHNTRQHNTVSSNNEESVKQ